MNNIQIIDIESATEIPANFFDIYNLWNGLPKSPELPLSSGFSLEFIPAKILPWSVLVDVETDPMDFRFRFWGTERTNLIGAEMTGKKLSNIADETMRQGNHDEYVDVVQRRNAVICHTPIITRTGLESSRLSIRLPLSSDGTTVSRIFSAVDPDTINEDHYAFYGTVPKRGI